MLCNFDSESAMLACGDRGEDGRGSVFARAIVSAVRHDMS